MRSYEKQVFSSRQFENRLFDRDTFLIAHYDVNFLFVIALYGRNDSSEKTAWRDKIRRMFREDIQKMLEDKFDFYVMTAHPDVNASAYIEDHFQQLLGKVFTPYDNEGVSRYYSLALCNDEKFNDENEVLIAQLKDAFYVEPCKIGDNPKKILKEVASATTIDTIPTTNFLTMHYLEKYSDKSIVIGCYKSQAHLDWILGKNDKGTLIYNLRLGKDIVGGQTKSQLDKMVVSFVILYEFGKEVENKYRVFHVHHHATMNAERLKKSLYPHEPNADKYFCYVFDEEVTLGDLEIKDLVSKDGSPVFKKGDELIKYRRKLTN